MYQMKNRYNIALIPTTQRDQVMSYAQNFSTLAGHYRLGERSLPHVTLCQFAALESEVESIWRKVGESVHPKTIRLCFNEISGTQSSRAFWISLLPNKSEVLLQMHLTIASIIRYPLNHSYKNYFPHMSLVNSKNPQYLDAIKKAELSYVPIEDDFILSLGLADHFGQYLEVLYS
jgi:2'-5' RNA ligase